MPKAVFVVATTPARVFTALIILACFTVATVATLTGSLAWLAGAMVVGAAVAYWRGLMSWGR